MANRCRDYMAQKQKESRERKKDKGLSEFRAWLFKHEEEQVREIVEKLLKERENDR